MVMKRLNDEAGGYAQNCHHSPKSWHKAWEEIVQDLKKAPDSEVHRGRIKAARSLILHQTFETLAGRSTQM